jgi:hypothetical protein
MTDEIKSLEVRPFKFLEFFSEKDQSRFAGRDWEIGVLLTGIAASRTYILFGRSGLGKTSLLLAGVFPRLRQRGILPVYLRVLEDPVGEVIAAISRDVGVADAATAADVLREHSPVALVFDQFEELFIRFRDRPAKRAALGALIAELTARVPSLTVVFSLREDFLGEVEEFKEYLPHLGEQSFRLLPLTAFGARQAIVLPLESCGAAYEEKLVTALIGESAKNGFDPLLLQIICSEIWSEASGGQAARRVNPLLLTTEHLKNVGGFDGIFRRYVQSVTADLDQNLHLVARGVLDALITAESTKYTVRKHDLIAGRVAPAAGEAKAALGQERERNPVYVLATETEISNVLEHLETRRIVRRIGNDDDAWYELLHDRLGPVLREWFRTDRDFVDFQFAKTFVASLSASRGEQHARGHLMNAKQLTEVVDPWRSRLRVSPAEAQLVLRSSIAAESARSDYWSDRLEAATPGATAEVLVEFLNDNDPSFRRAAIAQVPSLARFAPSCLPFCLQMALHDVDPSVRAAAATAFTTIAEDADIHQLLTLTEPSLRSAVIDVVAAFYEANRPAERFPYRVRIAGWYRAQRTRLALHSERIRTARNAGAAAGALTSLLWSATIGLWLIVIFKWTLFASSTKRGVAEVRDLATLFTGFAGAFALIASLLGLLIGGRAARRLSFGKWANWSGGTTRGGLQYICTFLLAAAVANQLAKVVDIGNSVEVLLPLFVILLFVSGAIALSSSGTRRAEDIDRDWGATTAFRAIVLTPPFAMAAAGAVFLANRASLYYRTGYIYTNNGYSVGDTEMITVLFASIVAASVSGAVGGALARRVNVYPRPIKMSWAQVFRILTISFVPLLTGFLGLVFILSTAWLDPPQRAAVAMMILTTAIITSFRTFNVGSCLLRLANDAPEADVPRSRAISLPRRIAPGIVVVVLMLGGLAIVGMHGTPLWPRVIDIEDHPARITSAVFEGWPTARYYTLQSRGLIEYESSGGVNSFLGNINRAAFETIRDWSRHESARFLTIGDTPVTVVGPLALQGAVTQRTYTVHAQVLRPAVSPTRGRCVVVVDLRRRGPVFWFGVLNGDRMNFGRAILYGATEPLNAHAGTRHLLTAQQSDNRLTVSRDAWNMFPNALKIDGAIRESESALPSELSFDQRQLEQIRSSGALTIEMRVSPKDATQLPDRLDLFVEFPYCR